MTREKGIMEPYYVQDFEASHPDALLSFEELVIKYGYSFENHEVVTADGYILSLFRIPSIIVFYSSNKKPVFLMHGLLGSAEDFIIAGPESGLAYLLAEEGYDVWLGNARGNKYSSRHLSLRTTDNQFWDFSWHEIGVYDLPAMIDYVLGATGQKTLQYIGYSQGVTAFLVMASKIPDYNNKVSVMIAMSPVAFMAKTRSPFMRIMSSGTSNLQSISPDVDLNEFCLDDHLKNWFRRTGYCGSSKIAESLCDNPVFLISGLDSSQLNISNLPVIFGHLPSGGSVKQFLHYGQLIRTEDFHEFDYDTTDNVEKYGRLAPPGYPLEKISTAICLIYGDDDWLADPRDVLSLSHKLKNVVSSYKVPYSQFSQMDFIIAKYVKTLVYEKLLKLLIDF